MECVQTFVLILGNVRRLTVNSERAVPDAICVTSNNRPEISFDLIQNKQVVPHGLELTCDWSTYHEHIAEGHRSPERCLADHHSCR